ncbi:hypothetical protein [Actinomadura formosensis]|uniref:hypothetical protein n=1 Tax=Actinomadura formosensis TaxID=60706 RepID=UPI003D91ACE4
MSARILAMSEVAAILAVDPLVVRTMVAGRELPALAVVAGDALISEGALREFIGHSWVDKPWEGLR